MRKTLLTLPALSLLLLAMAGGSQAGSNATVQITGNVVAATCDVSSSVTSIDLGNYTPAQFIAVATPVPDSKHQFTVGLNNCQNPLKIGDTASLVVLGDTLGGNPNIFNTSGTNTGVMLNQPANPTDFIRSGDRLLLSTAKKITDASDFNSKLLTFNAGIASSSSGSGVDTGSISAPITFQFAYN